MQALTQSTEYTTAAAGLLAILHELADVPLSLETELTIWRSSVLLPTRASSVFGLALVAQKHGLEPKIIVESDEYDYPDYRFKRYTKNDIELASKSHDFFLAAVKQKNIPLEVRDFGFEEVKVLAQDNFLLIRVNEGALRSVGSTSKYVVIYGFAKGTFHVLDPLQESPLLVVSEEKMRESFETLTSKKKRDHRLLAFARANS